MFDEVMPHGPATPPHFHAAMDEVFYVLDGTAEFVLGDRRQTARVGDTVFGPRGTVHGLQVTSATARFLNLYTPAGFERMLTTSDAAGCPTKRANARSQAIRSPSGPSENVGSAWLSRRARYRVASVECTRTSFGGTKANRNADTASSCGTAPPSRNQP